MTLIHVNDTVYDLADSMEITPTEAESLIDRLFNDAEDFAGLDADD